MRNHTDLQRRFLLNITTRLVPLLPIAVAVAVLQDLLVRDCGGVAARVDVPQVEIRHG